MDNPVLYDTALTLRHGDQSSQMGGYARSGRHRWSDFAWAQLDGVSVLSFKGSTDSAAPGFIETNVYRGKTSSILSRVSLENLDTIGAGGLLVDPRS